MKSGDLDAYIEIDGQRVEEYAVSQEREGFMSCCIPSEEGKKFVICCDHESKVYSYRAEFYLDGRLTTALCVQPGIRLRSPGQPSSSSEVLPYTFSPLRLSSDDAHASDIKDVEHLGTIELRIWRVKFTISREDWFGSGLKPDGVGAVHERSKKAGSHCVTFGAQATTPDIRFRRASNLEFIDPKDKPHCIFRFQYRSRDILQAQEIMPRIKKPVQAKGSTEPKSTDAARSVKRAREEDDDDVAKVKPESDEDVEDEDVIQAQMNELKAKLAKARSKRVKPEPSPIRLTVSGDTIDLTSD